MPATYEPIATTTLSSNAASTTFTSIPSTYTDLIIIVQGYMTADENVYLQFNSDTASNYSNTTLGGDASSAFSNRTSNQSKLLVGGLFTSSTGQAIHHVFNYANTTTNKTVLTRSDTAGNIVQARVGLWRSTSAITSILIGADSSSNFISGATFTLYGIKAA